MKKIILIAALNVIFLSCKKENEKSLFTIGQDYQGGKIAYIDATGLHGLIAAPVDQGTFEWHDLNLSAGNSTTNANGVEIGTGKSNTDAIIAFHPSENHAARICYDLVLGGYDDWYLPSKLELNQLYINRVAIGNFSNSPSWVFYWSSSEPSVIDPESAWGQSFATGSMTLHFKALTEKVRAVRSF
jgi:hypothetical protein